MKVLSVAAISALSLSATKASAAANVDCVGGSSPRDQGTFVQIFKTLGDPKNGIVMHYHVKPRRLFPLTLPPVSEWEQRGSFWITGIDFDRSASEPKNILILNLTLAHRDRNGKPYNQVNLNINRSNPGGAVPNASVVYVHASADGRTQRVLSHESFNCMFRD